VVIGRRGQARFAMEEPNHPGRRAEGDRRGNTRRCTKNQLQLRELHVIIDLPEARLGRPEIEILEPRPRYKRNTT